MPWKFFIVLFLAAQAAQAVEGDATVVIVRGIAKANGGKALGVQDKVRPGTTISTGARSFVKLLFKDNTQMNIGPDTTLKLEAVKAGDPGLVNLVGGQIRAKVTKDLLQGGEERKDKLLIKTRTAAMGVRGTDFNVSFNQQNAMTALVTFEGSVAMARVSGNEAPADALRQDAQLVQAGQYSGAQPDLPRATVPVKISPAQIESLRSNENFQGVGEKPAQKVEAQASPLPPGVDPKVFASGAEQVIAEAVARTAGAEAVAAVEQEISSRQPSAEAAKPEGSFDAATGTYAPRAGGFVDLSSGRYVPPPPGSAFDPNTGVYVPPRAMGSIDPVTGLYVPPQGVELDPVKGFVAEAPAAGQSGTQSPPPAVSALVQALNFSIAPENAGKEASFSSAFTPTGSSTGFVAPPPPPPPPPPADSNLLPPPSEPVDNPFCPTCITDNVNQTPTHTTVKFQITVQ